MGVHRQQRLHTLKAFFELEILRQCVNSSDYFFLESAGTGWIGTKFDVDPKPAFARKSFWQRPRRPYPIFVGEIYMSRSLGSWKPFVLMIVLGAPVGYWLLSHPSAPPSAVYAQQVVDSQ